MMTRSMLRILIGAFLAYMGYGLARDVYNEGGNPWFYLPAAIFVIAGLWICYYYYKQHKKELENPLDEDEEDSESLIEEAKEETEKTSEEDE